MSFNVGQWLEAMGLGQYKDTLASNGFDEKSVVAALTDADLKELGITVLGHRKKILLHAEELRGGAPSSATVAPAPLSPAATTASVPPPPSAAAPVPKPIQGLFRARMVPTIYSNYCEYPCHFFTPVRDNGHFYALQNSTVFVMNRAQATCVMRLSGESGVSFQERILFGWKEKLGVLYSAGSGKAKGPMLFSTAENKMSAKLDVFLENDRLFGATFANDNQLLARVYPGSQHDELHLIDAATGEPISKHDWGVNAFKDDLIGHQNCLRSHEAFPSMVWHVCKDKLLLLDVRAGLGRAAQTWVGTPWCPELFFENEPYDGAHRVTITGERRHEIWDIRQNRKLLSVNKDFAGNGGVTYRNVVVSHVDRSMSYAVHLWDLTKVSPDPSGELGAPTRTVNPEGQSGSYRPGSIAIDDARLFLGHCVISLNGSE